MLKQLAALAMVKAARRRRHTIDELERLHVAPAVPEFNDSSYFVGRRDETCIATRVAFRTGKPHERWLRLLLPGRAPLSLPEGPPSAGQGFSLGGLSFTCLAPGCTWQITYDGPALQGDDPVTLAVELRFEATAPIVDFGRHADEGAAAQVVASRPWSRDFFRRLEEIHKVHYEQGGRLVGVVRVDGESIPLDLLALRDHSFGRRTWGQWDRHLWWCVALEDGSFANVSMARYDFLPTLTAGYWVAPGPLSVPSWRRSSTGGSDPIDSLVQVDPFAALGPAAAPRSNGALRARLRRAGDVDITFAADQAMDFTMDDGAYFIREYVARFTVNGRPGVGIAEFGWNGRRHD